MTTTDVWFLAFCAFIVVVAIVAYLVEHDHG